MPLLCVLWWSMSHPKQCPNFDSSSSSLWLSWVFFVFDGIWKARGRSCQAAIEAGTGGGSESCFVGTYTETNKINLGIYKSNTVKIFSTPRSTSTAFFWRRRGLMLRFPARSFKNVFIYPSKLQLFIFFSNFGFYDWPGASSTLPAKLYLPSYFKDFFFRWICSLHTSHIEEEIWYWMTRTSMCLFRPKSIPSLLMVLVRRRKRIESMAF